MTRYAVAIAAALALALTGSGEAAQLLSPPYFLTTMASNVGSKAACVIRNAGTVPVAVSVALLSNNDVIPIFDFCTLNGKPRTLGAGETCLVSGDLSNGSQGLTGNDTTSGSYVACKVTAPSAINLRGTLELAESPSHGFDVYLAVDF